MKKNKLFLLGLFVVFAAVLSLSLVSNTFAKYVSTNSSTDTARVAKWGVKVTAETKDNNIYEADLSSVDGQISIDGATKLLAPGTAVNFASINITGTPEVEVKVTYEATLELNGWTYDGSDYIPLVFKVNNVEYSADNVADLIDDVENAIESYSRTYDENTNLEERVLEELTVSCYWAFGDGSTDVKDTHLGDLAAEGAAPHVNLKITCTVTQVE